MNKFYYIGTSWAASNFEPPGSSVTDGSVNLAKIWGLDYIDLSKNGQRFTEMLPKIKLHLLSKKLPIIYIYGEPSFSCEELFSISFLDFIKEPNWQDIWHRCNNHILNEISKLGVPVLLFGGHSDIVNCNYNNITVGNSSYQKFLAEKGNLASAYNSTICNNMLGHCWGPDIAHKQIFQNTHISTPASLVESISTMFNFWKELENVGLFYDTHPTAKGIELFANKTKNTVLNFLERNK